MRLFERLASFPADFHFLKKVNIARSVKPSIAVAASVSGRWEHKSYAVSHQYLCRLMLIPRTCFSWDVAMMTPQPGIWHFQSFGFFWTGQWRSALKRLQLLQHLLITIPFRINESTILPEAVQNELMTLWDIKSTTKPKRRMPRSRLTRPTNKARVDAPAKRSSSPSRFTASRAWPVNKLISAVGPTWSCRRVPGWFILEEVKGHY